MGKKEGGPKKDEEGAKPAGKKGSPLMMGVVLLVVAVGLALGAMYFVMMKPSEPKKEVIKPPVTWPEEEALSVTQTLLGGGAMLQVQFKFGVVDNGKPKELAELLEKYHSKIVDTVGTIIAEMDENLSVEVGAREHIKSESKRKINEFLREAGEVEVEEMYIVSYTRMPTNG